MLRVLRGRVKADRRSGVAIPPAPAPPAPVPPAPVRPRRPRTMHNPQ